MSVAIEYKDIIGELQSKYYTHSFKVKFVLMSFYTDVFCFYVIYRASLAELHFPRHSAAVGRGEP